MGTPETGSYTVLMAHSSLVDVGLASLGMSEVTQLVERCDWGILVVTVFCHKRKKAIVDNDGSG